MPVADVVAWRGGGPGLAALSAYLAGVPQRVVAPRLVTELVDADLLRVRRPEGEDVLVLAGSFADLWARTPSALLGAIRRCWPS